MTSSGGAAYVEELLADASLRSEIAQIQAKAVLTELKSIPEQVRWRYIAPRVVRNMTGALISLEDIALHGNGQIDSLQGSAGRVARAWEALAELGESTSTEAATLNSAVAYELAGFQANAVCLARRLLPEPFRIESPSITSLSVLFLQRYLVLLRRLAVALEGRPTDSLQGADELTHRASSGLAARALSLASHYFLNGDEQALRDSVETLNLSYEGFASTGDVIGANLTHLLRSLVPVMAERSTWNRLRPFAPDSPLWDRYLKLLARGLGPNALRSPSVSEIWPSQQTALDAGLLGDGASKIVRMPTSAGKTRIAEMGIAHSFVSNPGTRCLYVAPYRALVGEVEGALNSVFSDLGYKVSSVLGTYESDALERLLASDADLLVVTPEKLDLFLRLEPEYLSNVRLIIIDEGHLVNDWSRGVKFELLVTRLKRRLPAAKFMFLSAVVPQQTLNDLARWFKAAPNDVITSDWRPAIQRVARFNWSGGKGFIRYVPFDDTEVLQEFVPAVIQVQTYEYPSPRSSRILHRTFPDPTNKSQTAAELAVRFAELGSVLVFCPQRDLVESVGRALETRLALLVRNNGTPPYLETKATYSVAIAEEWLGEDHLVTRLLRSGVAIHHGRLPEVVRRAIENDFRSRRFRILVATNTLAQGVNLPIRTVIIHSCRRRSDVGSELIPARDYWNIAGRAGRAGEETEGTIIHIVRTPQDQLDFQHYLDRRQSLEPLESALLQIMRYVVAGRISDEALANELDPEILALLVEEAPENLSSPWVESFLEETLLNIQAGPNSEFVPRLARVSHEVASSISLRIPDAIERRTFSGTGLSSTSCATLQQHVQLQGDLLRNILVSATLENLGELSGLALRSCEDVREMQPESSFAGSYSLLLAAWLQGIPMSGLVEQFGQDVPSRQDLSRFIDEYFGYRLPWGISAYIRIALRHFQVDDDALSPVAQFFPGMVKFGVPSPEAVWAMTAGVGSRRVAIELAAAYIRSTSDRSFRNFLDWARSWQLEELEDFGLSGVALQEVHSSFSRAGRNQLLAGFRGLAAVLPLESSVVGTRYLGRSDLIARLQVGDTVYLERDYDNVIDRNAVAVSAYSKAIGYLPRDVAQLVAPELDTGAGLSARIVKIEDQQRPVVTIDYLR